MRLENICTIAEANKFAPKFIAKHNEKYAKPPKDTMSAFRANTKSDKELNLILSKQDIRRVTRRNIISFEGAQFQLDNNFKNRLCGQSVKLYRCFNGDNFITWNNILIAHSLINKIPINAPKIATSKNINDFIDKISANAA